MDVVLQLGDITFDWFEIPEVIPFGGAQRLARHQLPGGRRVIQALGRDDAPIAWEGIFLGEQATDRARALDAMRVAGAPVTLSWHEFLFTVVVAECSLRFEHPARVPYQITCEVVEDLTAAITQAPRNSVDMTIREDLAACDAEVLVIDDPDLTTLNGQMQAAARAIVDFQRTVQAQIQPIVATASAIRGRVRLLQDTATAALKGAAALTSIVPGSAARSLTAKLNAGASAANTIPALQRLDWRITRTMTNLQTANFGASSVARTLSAGDSLFSLAGREYGDGSRWPEIARASGRTDPSIARIAPVVVPR